MPIAILFLLAAIAVAFAAWRRHKRELQMQKWPFAKARVIERPPQSLFERSDARPNHHAWVLNTDSDHFLEWVVDRKKYRRRERDRATAEICGIKVWRKPPKMGKRRVQYNPENPQELFEPHDRGSWILLAVAAAAFVFAAIYVSL